MTNPFILLINSYLPEPEASLLNGMLFGVTQGFSKDFYQALINTGVVHVVALSGMNITILVNLLAKLTLPLGRKLSSLASIAAITGFILFVSPSPTIVRAGLMGALSLFAVYLGRQSWMLLNLLLVGFLMLIIEPKLLGNLSFQLSFLSTLGIMVFAPTATLMKLKRDMSLQAYLWSYIKKIFRENLHTTLAAQAATLPLIIFSFGRISLVSPLTNVLVGWTIYILMILGFAVSIQGWLFYPLGQITAWLAYPVLHYFVRVVEITAGIPFASISLK